MQNQTLMIKLSDIAESGLNPRGSIKPGTIDELAKDIKTHGLINSLTIRKMEGCTPPYQLIAGHRRFAALKKIFIADEEVSCNVVVANDEEAFEIMVIENLQREDIHPLDEAIAFKTLSKKSGIVDLSIRIAKDIQYITRRLKLNDLIPEVQKLFRSGSLELGHCVEICRLSPELQKECIKEISDEEGHGNNNIKFFKSVKQLQHFIKTELMCSLDAAPWKKDDADLYKKAGSCDACEKNTANSQTLFPELAKNATCLDGKCYAMKSDLFMKATIKFLIDEGHELYGVSTKYYPGYDDKKEFPNLKSVLGREEFKQLEKEKPGSATGIFVDGPAKGQTIIIMLPSAEKSKSSSSKSSKKEPNAAEQIAAINERTKRGVEIDRQKVFDKLKIVLEKNDHIKSSKVAQKELAITKNENVLFWYAVLDNFGYPANKIVEKFINLELKKDTDKMFTEIDTFLNDANAVARFKRMMTFELLKSKSVERVPFVHDQFIIIADHLKVAEAKTIIDEQNAVRDRRITNAQKKINALKKPAVKKEVKKTAKKSSPKKSKKK